MWIANLGDSQAFLVKENGQIVQLSKDAKAGDLRYAKGIFDRSGCVAFSREDLLQRPEEDALQTVSVDYLYFRMP